MTTAQGAPVADDQNWLSAGPRGPALLDDHIAREKIFHFDHERIPERVVDASDDPPAWELGIQAFDQEFADQFEFDVLDATKIIPEAVVPVRRIGRKVLDRPPRPTPHGRPAPTSRRTPR